MFSPMDLAARIADWIYWNALQWLRGGAGTSTPAEIVYLMLQIIEHPQQQHRQG